jgi:hypothetical protein
MPADDGHATTTPELASRISSKIPSPPARQEGLVTVSGMMSKDFRQVILDSVTMEGGIPYHDQTGHAPGFTTKKRGWGLASALQTNH